MGTLGFDTFDPELISSLICGTKDKMFGGHTWVRTKDPELIRFVL